MSPMAVKELTMSGPDLSPMPAPPADSDDALLRRYFQQRDRAALGTFFQRHADRAYRLALCICGDAHRAEEAVQAAFLRVLTVKAEPPRNAAAWLATVVVNACRAEMRAEKRRRAREETIAMQHSAADAGSVPGAAEQTELINTALRTVKGLPEHYRLPVWLHFVDNLSFAEVGAALGLSEGTVREQARRGLAHVRETLTAGGMLAAATHLPQLLQATPLPAAPATLLASLQHAALHGSTAGASLTAKFSAGALTKVGLGATVLLVGALTASRLLPPVHSRETKAEPTPAPPPKVAPVAETPPTPTAPTPASRTLDVILATRLDARFRRDYPGEVLRDLQERTGLKSAMPAPLGHAFLFTFEKQNATVKEVLEKLAADGQFQLEYHDPVVAVWKKADDALLTELASQLKTPAADDAVRRLGALADPRIYPLLFETIATNAAERESTKSVLYNSHRDCLAYAHGIDQTFESLLAEFKKADDGDGSGYLLAAASRDRRFIEPLLEVAKKQNSPTVCIEAAEAALLLGSDKAGAILLEFLQNEDKNVRISAAWALAKTQDPRGFEGLLKLAHSPLKEIRATAAYTLENFADARSRDALLELLNDDDPIVSGDAASALGRLQDVRAIPGLVKLVKTDTKMPSEKAWFGFFSSNFFFRQLSPAEALGCIVDDRAFAALRELRRSNSAAIRARTVQGLAISRTPEAFNLVLGMVLDDDGTVRKLAAEALGTTRDERAYSILSDHAEVRDASVRSGVALGLGLSRDPRAFDTLKKLGDDPDKDVRCDAIVGLSLLHDTRATPIFARLARDPEDSVSHTACEALAVSRDSHAADELIACVNDANEQVAKNAKDSLMLAMSGGDQRLINLNFYLMFKDLKLPPQKPAEPQPKPDAKTKDEF